MNRILATVLLYLSAFTPVLAAPLYAGIQIDDTSAGLLFGYPISKTYAIEAHYTKSSSRISHAGVTVDTASTGMGVVGVARFPMKLNDGLPYSLFVKGGYEHTTSTDTCSIPTSATLTLPYDNAITSHKNQVLFGGGAEYDFSTSLIGRLGMDFLGGDRSINLAAIFKF
jgi:hypothetical protein